MYAIEHLKGSVFATAVHIFQNGDGGFASTESESSPEHQY